MKIQLPLENWSDLLPFVPRPQLVALLFQLDDRQFASILQYCLNEVGHITLGHLCIRAPKENGPIVELCKIIQFSIPDLETTLPDEPIPKNVHSFSSLAFRYFDSSVLNFLQKFNEHQNSLLANTNLSIIRLPMEKVQSVPVMAQILPLIGDNIDSLKLVDHELLGYSRLLKNIQSSSSGNNEEFSELMTQMLVKTRILSMRYRLLVSAAFDWYSRWLYAPRVDGRPRMLSISLTTADALHFFNLIKKDFLMAKHPVTFFIRIQTYSYMELENIYLENGKTSENLLMVKKLDGELLISRFLMASNSEWIQANGQEILEFGRVSHDRTIYIWI